MELPVLKICQISGNMTNIEVKGKITIKRDTRDVKTRYGIAKVSWAILENETGSIRLNLWRQQINQVREGDTVGVVNAFVRILQKSNGTQCGMGWSNRYVGAQTSMEVKKAFSELLRKWYRKNGRGYVWRKKKNPYEILMAEIMLQRTKADQVESTYIDFINRFPNVWELSRATEKEIIEYFGRLGLLWRAKRVKHLADQLIDRFGGEIPKSRDLLLSLPGVGEYIADAVLCFAYGKDIAVVDANVCRLIERVFGIVAKGEARRDHRFRMLAQEMVPSGKANEFNWAMIDFAALVCTPRNPKHSVCPMNEFCSYYQKLRLSKA